MGAFSGGPKGRQVVGPPVRAGSHVPQLPLEVRRTGTGAFHQIGFVPVLRTYESSENRCPPSRARCTTHLGIGLAGWGGWEMMARQAQEAK